MIHCQFFVSNDRFVGFAINGHDEPDDSGVSLLCASVSSAAYLTANTITDIVGLEPLVLETGDGLMTLRLSDEDARKAAVTLAGLCLHLQSLAEENETLLTVNITEV